MMTMIEMMDYMAANWDITDYYLLKKICRAADEVYDQSGMTFHEFVEEIERVNGGRESMLKTLKVMGVINAL